MCESEKFAVTTAMKIAIDTKVSKMQTERRIMQAENLHTKARENSTEIGNSLSH